MPIYKDRALKHLVKLAGGKKVVQALNPEQLKKMMAARNKVAADMQFNTLKWFRPFPYQKKFFETGTKSTRRRSSMVRVLRIRFTTCCFSMSWHGLKSMAS